jgi:hypothetical protein
MNFFQPPASNRHRRVALACKAIPRAQCMRPLDRTDTAGGSRYQRDLRRLSILARNRICNPLPRKPRSCHALCGYRGLADPLIVGALSLPGCQSACVPPVTHAAD